MRKATRLARRFWMSMSVAIVATACSQPTAPTVNIPAAPTAPPSAPQLLTVSGTVWVRANDGVRPLTGGGRLQGWLESGNAVRSIGAIPVDVNGSYSVTVPVGLFHVYNDELVHQPCAASRTVTADTTRDVTLLADWSLVGGRLPAEVVAGTRTLSGTVYEIDSDGNRRPIGGVWVVFDRGYGTWMPFADTQTDADGRYVLCGLDAEASVFLDVMAAGHQEVFAQIALAGNTSLDIEMKRK